MAPPAALGSARIGNHDCAAGTGVAIRLTEVSFGAMKYSSTMQLGRLLYLFFVESSHGKA